MNENAIRVKGYCQRDLLAIIKKIEAWNEGKKCNIYCKEDDLVLIFNSHDKFGIHDIIIDEKWVNDMCIKYDLEYTSRCIIVGEYSFKIIGIIEI
jgi:hypothetical protein